MTRALQGKTALAFGKFLRKRRKELGLALSPVAAQYNVALSYLSDLENGYINPRRISLEVAFKISLAYKIKLEALLQRIKLLPEK